MAKLTFVEQENFEKIFDMSQGYVLDFSNSTFQRFVYSVMGIDIYQKYVGLSKAKILRAIISEYDNVTVGKLLLELLNYQQSKDSIQTNDKETFLKCVNIGNRLIGKTTAPLPKKVEKSAPVPVFFDYKQFKSDLMELSKMENKQARGYSLETYLDKLFEKSQLEPRKSFKLVGEQIDGSFVLHKEVYLLEAKWTDKKTDKSELVIFNEKVSSKSGFTRGLFISNAGYTDEALSTFSNGRKVNIVLMTIQEIAIMLERQNDLKDIIWKKTRLLAEEGVFFKEIFEM